MSAESNEEQLLRSVALQNANAILLARQRAERELLQAKDALEIKTCELAHSLSMMRATLESSTDGVLVTDENGKLTAHNDQLATMWSLPPEILEPGEHLTLLAMTSQKFENPQAFRARIEEIYASSPPESYDLLELLDGRAIERFSRIQRIDNRNVGRVWTFRDVTERRRPEEARAQLAAIVESSVDAIISKSLAGIITSWNKSASQMFGYTAEEVVGKPITILIPPDRLDEESAILERLRRGERIEHYETIRMRKDGGLLNIALSVSPIRDESGRVIGASKIARDITERVRAEEQIRQQREWFQITLASIGDAVITTDTQGRVTFLNPVAESMTGWPAGEASGRALDEIFHVVDAETGLSVPSPMDTVLQEGIPVVLDHHSIQKHKDGAIVAVEDSAAPIKDAGGKTLGGVLVFHDVSERRRSEEALRESGERLRFMAESMPQMIFTATPRGDVDYFNQQWMRFTGLSFEQLVEVGWKQVLHPDDFETHQAKWNQSLATGQRFELEHRVRSHNGAYHWHICRAHAMRNTEGRVVMWIGSDTDIDAMKQHEQEREMLLDRERSARARAEQSDRVKDEFLATLSHELRTPLSAILGWSQLLSKRELDDEAKLGLSIIERNCRAQAQLIEDMLDMSRIASGKLRLEMRTVYIHDVIAMAIESARPAAEAKGIQIVSELDPKAGPVLGDADRLQQIAWNLLSNAVKFTGKGGLIRAALSRVSSHLEFSVEDNGVGIKPEFLPHVFERFRQADASSIRKHGGLGLGLSIVKSLAELHGGTVHAESEGEGKGAEFVIRLPVLAAIRKDERDKRSRTEVGHAGLDVEWQQVSLRGLTVLVVDDEKDARGIIQRILEDCDAKVGTSASAREALSAIRRDPPDVLVCDIGMPEQDGYALLHQIRGLDDRQAASVPAVALTAFARPEDQRRAILGGFQLHLAKPVNASELTAAVASLAGTNASASETPEATTTSDRPLRVLVVDHNETMLSLMRRILERSGYDVQQAANLAAAKRLAQARTFDLLISGLTLPDGDGAELVRVIRSNPAAEAIAIANHVDDGDAPIIRKAGFAEYLVKPLELGALEAAVRRAAQRATSSKESRR